MPITESITMNKPINLLDDDAEWQESFDALREVTAGQTTFYLDCLTDVAGDKKSTAKERKLAGRTYDLAVAAHAAFGELWDEMRKRDAK